MANPSEGLVQTSGLTTNVIPLPLERTRRAYELLASQPLSVAGLSSKERREVVITAVVDDQGREHVVSRFPDPQWNLQSEFKVENRPLSKQILKWPEDVPIALVEDAKAAIYAWYRRGKPGWKRPSPTSLYLTVVNCGEVLKHLASYGATRFDEVKPIHLHDYVAKLRAQAPARTTMRYRLEVIEVVAAFKEDVQFPLTFEPWDGETLASFIGGDHASTDEAGKTGKTAVIPPSVQEALFVHAETILRNAPALLDVRDMGELPPYTDRLSNIRDAVLYLVQISTGMRNSETAGIRNGSWRTEVRDGVTFHWIATFEHKTGKGRVEFLAPPEAIEALEVLQRWAVPYQERLRMEALHIEELLRSERELESAERVRLLQRLDVVRASQDSLFLALDGGNGGDGIDGNRVCVMTLTSAAVALKRLALKAGVNWRPANHQCRRTFAWTVAQSRLGRRSLVFLKWQLKHSSMSMTQLYAANPLQDESLYDELYEEILASRTEVLASWFEEDQALAGGAGKKIQEFRGSVATNRGSLLAHAAPHVSIRSNGHSWCLSEQRGCGGEGLYDASLCADCSGAVIDQGHADTWKNIHLLNRELLTIKDCGPGVEQRAAREVAISERVLQDLGIVPPVSVERPAYTNSESN